MVSPLPLARPSPKGIGCRPRGRPVVIVGTCGAPRRPAAGLRDATGAEARADRRRTVLEISVPALVTPDPAANLTELVTRAAAEAPEAVLFSRPASRPDAAGVLEDVTSAAFLAEVGALAKGLIAAGVGPGDRVALMAKTRYEWTLTDFAIWFAGAITVPVYETSSPEQVAWILSDSAAVAVVTETPAHGAVVDGVRDRLPALKHAWSIDAGDLTG